MHAYGVPQVVLSVIAQAGGLGGCDVVRDSTQYAVLRDVVRDATPWGFLSALLPLFGWLKRGAESGATPIRPRVRDLLFGAVCSADGQLPLSSRARWARLPWRGKAVLLFGLMFGMLGVVSLFIEALFARFTRGIFENFRAIYLLVSVVAFLFVVGCMLLVDNFLRKNKSR